MSKKHQVPVKPHTIDFLSILLISALILFAVLFLILSENQSDAIDDIWSHFKNISLIVVGYVFGSSKK
jgi:hypothetical protein|tara:strand:- start:485 stop:688 length:204 start_codon:yes stop_codon:yes gene_type:complete